MAKENHMVNRSKLLLDIRRLSSGSSIEEDKQLNKKLRLSVEMAANSYNLYLDQIFGDQNISEEKKEQAKSDIEEAIIAQILARRKKILEDYKEKPVELAKASFDLVTILINLINADIITDKGKKLIQTDGFLNPIQENIKKYIEETKAESLVFENSTSMDAIPVLSHKLEYYCLVIFNELLSELNETGKLVSEMPIYKINYIRFLIADSHSSQQELFELIKKASDANFYDELTKKEAYPQPLPQAIMSESPSSSAEGRFSFPEEVTADDLSGIKIDDNIYNNILDYCDYEVLIDIVEESKQVLSAEQQKLIIECREYLALHYKKLKRVSDQVPGDENNLIYIEGLYDEIKLFIEEKLENSDQESFINIIAFIQNEEGKDINIIIPRLIDLIDEALCRSKYLFYYRATAILANELTARQTSLSGVNNLKGLKQKFSILAVENLAVLASRKVEGLDLTQDNDPTLEDLLENITDSENFKAIFEFLKQEIGEIRLKNSENKPIRFDKDILVGYVGTLSLIAEENIHDPKLIKEIRDFYEDINYSVQNSAKRSAARVPEENPGQQLSYASAAGAARRGRS